jgi:toxin ParE1/3/4
MPGRPDRRLIWAPEADQDLLGIWSYYVTEASAEIADKIVQQIVTAARRLTGLPLSGRPRDDLKPGLRAVLAHPYAIFYRLKNGDVEIVRVLHERRNLPKALAKSD